MIGQKTVIGNVGGVEGHVSGLSSSLARRGHEVTVFIRRRYGTPTMPDGVHLSPRPCLPTKHLEAITHSTLCSLEAGLRGFDIIHYHAVGPALTIPFARLSTRPGICVTVHDQDYNKAKWSPWARRFLRAGERTACRRADEVIVVARYLQEHLRASYGRSSHYVPNGNEALQFLPAGPTLQALGLEEGRYLLYLGRLVPEKGCDVLIKAIRQSDTPYSLAVVGGASHSGGYADLLRELAAGDDRIVFTGHRSGSELAELRSNAACYVMPSKQEGLPLSLLEALWVGMPVIATDIPAVHEIVGTVDPSRITLVAPDDVRGLATAVGQLPWPGAPNHPGSIAWPTWDDIAAQVESVYERCVPIERRRHSRRAARV